jgi:hypothetical protein
MSKCTCQFFVQNSLTFYLYLIIKGEAFPRFGPFGFCRPSSFVSAVRSFVVGPFRNSVGRGIVGLFRRPTMHRTRSLFSRGPVNPAQHRPIFQLTYIYIYLI